MLALFQMSVTLLSITAGTQRILKAEAYRKHFAITELWISAGLYCVYILYFVCI